MIPKFEEYYEGILLNPKVIVFTPPQIPSQRNDFDCGIFMIQFEKRITFEKNFHFESRHIKDFREEISSELIGNNLRT